MLYKKLAKPSKTNAAESSAPACIPLPTLEAPDFGEGVIVDDGLVEVEAPDAEPVVVAVGILLPADVVLEAGLAPVALRAATPPLPAAISTTLLLPGLGLEGARETWRLARSKTAYAFCKKVSPRVTSVAFVND